MRAYKAFLTVLTVLLLSGGVFGQGGLERYLKATEILETELHFVYQGTYIPVPDITYHEFSADSITWRKNYVDGDCYVRFSNVTDNSTNPYTSLQGYHPDTSWWVFNFCTCNGAITDGTGTSNIDTLYINYGGEIDTVTLGNITIDITDPDTVSGTSTNFQDSLIHTHELYVFLHEIEDVDTAGVADGDVIKYNEVRGIWEVAEDLTGGGGGSLRVQELDNDPLVNNVTEIKVTNGHLINNGAGSVTLDLTLDPVSGVNDYWRTDTVRVGAGETFISFDTALPDNDYVVPGLFAILDNGNRQNVFYDSLTVNGFNVSNVVDSAYIHYIAIRGVDSLLATIEDKGRIYTSANDDTLDYLSQALDDTTITMTNEELTVLASGLDHDSLRNLEWSVAGHTIDTTVYMNGNALDSVGTVAIGTSSPTSTFHVVGSRTLQIDSVATDTTLGITHEIIEVTSNATITLPTAVGIEGRTYTIKNTSGTTITIDANGTETIDGNLTITSSPFESYKIISNGSNWLII